jgi:hypothetical protein
LSSAFWATPLTAPELGYRLSNFVSELDTWGEVKYADEIRDGLWEFRAEVSIPAFSFPGVRLIFDELYVPQPDRRWVLEEYCYNFVDDTTRRFFGYHHQPVEAGGQPVSQVHCRHLDRPDHVHRVGPRISPQEALPEFLQWAADQSTFPRCSDFAEIGVESR